MLCLLRCAALLAAGRLKRPSSQSEHQGLYCTFADLAAKSAPVATTTLMFARTCRRQL